jgi:hypothetical protein
MQGEAAMCDSPFAYVSHILLRVPAFYAENGMLFALLDVV